MTVPVLFLTLSLLAAQDGLTPQTPAPRSPAPAQTPRQAGPTPAAPAPTPAAAAPAVAITPQREGQPVNIKVDVSITEQRAGSQVFKKTVTVVTADAMGGFIRSNARYRDIGDVPLNVDAQPRLLADGKIRVNVNLQYDLPANFDTSETPRVSGVAGPLTKTSIHENLSLVLENNKAIVAAQSADPVGDRQVLIEVKATVLR